MLTSLRKRGVALLAVILTLAGIGISAPALAEEEDTRTSPFYTSADQAYLTKVIDAAENLDTSADTYTFQFAKITEDAPTIDSKVVKGVVMDDAHSRGTSSIKQAVVRTPLSEILNGVVFPHAGVYEYTVTEASALRDPNSTDKVYINPSAAEFILRVTIKNSENDESTAGDHLVVDGITVERRKDDDGNELNATTTPKAGKVDAALPRVTQEGGNIISDDGTVLTYGLAGDGRGRNVNGFTFANEYVKGGPVTVTKVVTGTYANKTQKFPVSITIHDNAAVDGAAISYKVSENAIDITNGTNEDGSAKPATALSGVSSYAGDSMVEFKNGEKEVTITALLANGDSVELTGLWGWLSSELYDNHIGTAGTKDNRMRFTDGLKQGTVFRVKETEFGLYTANVDVTSVKDKSAVRVSRIEPDVNSKYEFESSVAEDGALVTVTNNLLDEKVSPTGILIDNLPYIIMVGVPLVVFALLFVSRRRNSVDV